MEQNPRFAAAAHRPTPVTAAIAAWTTLVLGFAYLFVPPRDGPAFGAWDAVLQIAVLFLLFTVVPFTAVQGIDLYRAHVKDSPEMEARHRFGFLLLAAAGVIAIVAWITLAVVLGGLGS